MIFDSILKNFPNVTKVVTELLILSGVGTRLTDKTNLGRNEIELKEESNARSKSQSW